MKSSEQDGRGDDCGRCEENIVGGRDQGGIEDV